MTLEINPGNGLTFNSDHELTLNVDPTSPYCEKRLNGILVHDLTGDPGESGQSTEDNYTIIKNASDKLQTNPNVVEYIFSMNAYKVIERTRTSKDTYSVDETQLKTPQDIINELNALMDNTSGRFNGTSYLFKPGNLFQLRNTVTTIKGRSDWPVVIDDLNRTVDMVCFALFYVKAVSYSQTTDKYCLSLTLTCLWSSLNDYVPGTDYSATALHNY